MPALPSLARQFFDDIRDSADPVAYLRGLIDPAKPTYESDYLDCKADPAKEKERKEIWYKALSGFANNQGGVLIWGLDARKDAAGIDRVCDEVPVDAPHALKSRLTELQRDATNPPLGNVEIEAYRIPGPADKGFVVCFIPEGPFKPYRAEVAGKQQYYIRFGDKFEVPTPSILRTLFYPKTRAHFEVTAALSYELPTERRIPLQAILTCRAQVHNRGTATAKETFIVARGNAGKDRRRDFEAGPEWARTRTSQGEAGFVAKRPLHPGVAFHLFTLEWYAPVTVAYSKGNLSVPACDDTLLELTAYAEGEVPQRVELRFDMEELIRTDGRPQERRGVGQPLDVE